MVSFEAFPRLAQALKHICEEYGTAVFCEPFSNEMYGTDYAKPTEEDLIELYSRFERALSPLSSDELLVVSLRGDAESDYLIRKYGLTEFNHFLNRYYEEDLR